MTRIVEIGQTVVMSVSKKTKFRLSNLTIGIDEVGRGPLAGPLAVGAFATSNKILKFHFSNIKESKQLRPKQREEWFKIIKRFSLKREVFYAITFVSATTIDRIGLTKALLKAVASNLRKLDATKNTKIILDGSLYAPKKYTNQKTIIKGDEKEPLIALASIVAKILRDRKMTYLAKKFPEYGFEIHKGYGTKLHYNMIKKYGISPIHRRSFLKSVSH